MPHIEIMKFCQNHCSLLRSMQCYRVCRLSPPSCWPWREWCRRSSNSGSRPTGDFPFIYIFSLLRIGSGVPFWPRDQRWVKNKIRIRDEQPGSYFRERIKKFFGLKYLNYFMRIRDGKKFGSGIRDKHPRSTTLHFFITGPFVWGL
jgi:hypothetical protein